MLIFLIVLKKLCYNELRVILMLKLNSVSKVYKKSIVALDDINLEFSETGLVFLRGDSGSGKSTLLNIMSTLESPSSGCVYFNDRVLDKTKVEEYMKNDISVIFQDANLFLNLSVKDNLNIYENHDIDDELLKKLNILDLKDKLVRNLSGGEKRRVAIARAIIKDPKVLLCDEPDASLDEENRENIFKILKYLSKSMLVVVSSHDGDIEEYADRIITLDDGKVIDDKVLKKGSIKLKKNNESFVINKKFINVIAKDILFSKKLNYLFATIILSVFLSLILIMGVITKYDYPRILADTLEHENNSVLFVEEGYIPRSFLLDEEIIYTAPNGMEYSTGNKYLGLNINVPTEMTKSSVEENYYRVDSENLFFSYNDDFLTGDLIGDKPREKDEILIYEILAEKIIYYGIYTPNNELLKPKDINELIGKYVMLGDVVVKISGIIKQDDIDKFNSLKEESFYMNAETNLKKDIFYSLFSYKIDAFSSCVLITSDFFDYIEGHYKEEVEQSKFNAIMFEKNKSKQIEYLAKVNKEKHHNLYWMIANGDIGSLELTGTPYAYASSVIFYAFLLGQALILLLQILIVIIIYIIMMYFENIYKKSRDKFAILLGLGLTKANMNKIIKKISLIYFGVSLLFAILIFILFIVLGNNYMSQFVSFYLHPFKVNVVYLSFTLLMVLFILSISYGFLKLRLKKKNAILYLKNN